MLATLAWRRWLYASLLLMAGCQSAEEYAAARATWEARDSVGPPSCPASRRRSGTCISDRP